MESGGDAIRQQLRLGFAHRKVGREIHPRPRLQLPLERIPVQINDTRQHQQSRGIEPWSSSAGFQPVYQPVLQQHIGPLQTSTFQQNRPA